MKANLTVRLFLFMQHQKILFVCLGNICRSPLAEGIMLHFLQNKNEAIKVDSAGTAHYHVGEKPDNRTIENALKHGVDLNGLRARQFKAIDLDEFDYIFAMDKNNLRHILSACKTVEQKNKVHLFLPFSGNVVVEEMPDPYYGTEKDFEKVFQLTYTACKDVFNKLTENDNQ